MSKCLWKKKRRVKTKPEAQVPQRKENEKTTATLRQPGGKQGEGKNSTKAQN